MARDKVRIRFQKGGDLRFISHHDLMRCFERMLRRAAIPVHCTQGYNPKPRLVFALSLALGIVGCEEVAELELEEAVDPEDLRQLLAREAPQGLEILSVERIAPKSGARVRRMTYRLPLPDSDTAAVQERITVILAAPDCWIRRAKAGDRPVDLRASIADLRVASGFLEFDLRPTPQGTARPEEVLDLLGVSHLLERGAVIERIRLELEEEPVASQTGSLPANSAPQGSALDSLETKLGSEAAALDACASRSPGSQLEGSS
jgi:radical SAM-linked protein